MLVKDVFCYAIFMAAVTATFVKGENQQEEHSVKKAERRFGKRDTSLFIDNFPLETVVHKPKIIYRRTSHQRYAPPKPKYGPPKPKYGPPKSTRRPSKYKKYTTKSSSKHRPVSYKKKTPKPRYGPPKKLPHATYNIPKKFPRYSFYPQEPAGFAEPPTFVNEYQPPFSYYSDVLTDSYGAPLKPTSNEPIPTGPNFPDTTSNIEITDYTAPEAPPRHQNSGPDNYFAYSIKHPIYNKPNDETFESPSAPDYHEEGINTYYSDNTPYKQKQREKNYLLGKTKPQFPSDNLKLLNRPWKAQKVKIEPDDEILVGGQYAEPPARYVPKFQPSAPMLINDEHFSPPQVFGESDSAPSGSASISPYVNYKNSNMAFSPQNLNDAFSIVDK